MTSPPPSSPMQPDVGVILLAAGQSRRMGPGVPKALRTVAGLPLYRWALDSCLAGTRPGHAVVVVPAEHVRAVQQALGRAIPGIPLSVVAGGPTRAASARAGLRALPPDARWVLLHDAARPLASPRLHAAVLSGAREHGAATAALDVVDALRFRQPPDQTALYLERGNVVRVQTPQACRRDWLEEAHRRAPPDDPPDDAALVSAAGHPVALVPGEPDNRKVTVASDLDAAALRLAGDGTPPTLRVGTGSDIHRLVPGRPLWLGGVQIPHPRGLLGHSDGDVACHAIADALLGAAGLGDLGEHFPPGDPAWAGASGTRILTEVRSKLLEQGYRVGNVDVTILAEFPRLAPHRAAMREAVAWGLGVPVDRVSVKATTAEGLGPVGAGLAIAAQAVASVQSLP